MNNNNNNNHNVPSKDDPQYTNRNASTNQRDESVRTLLSAWSVGFSRRHNQQSMDRSNSTTGSSGSSSSGDIPDLPMNELIIACLDEAIQIADDSSNLIETTIPSSTSTSAFTADDDEEDEEENDDDNPVDSTPRHNPSQ
jgi:hypothetical protein